MPLDKIYTTYNSINSNEIKEKKKQIENFTVQMEVNIKKINNPSNGKINLNQTNIIQRPSIQSSPKASKEADNHSLQEKNMKEELKKNVNLF